MEPYLPRRIRALLAAAAMLIASCGGPGGGATPGPADAPGVVDATPATDASPTGDAAPVGDAAIDAASATCVPTLSTTGLVVQLAGHPVRVWDGISNGAPHNTSDARPSPYRTADGRAHLMLSHYDNYRLSGATLETLIPTPQPTFLSSRNESTTQADYGYHQWIMAPYSEDGTHFYALAHSEWYGCLAYGGDPVRGCAAGAGDYPNTIRSWVNAITLFASNDGGQAWHPQGIGSDHVVVGPAPPYPSWDYWTPARPRHVGMFHPSNIVRADAYYYALFRYAHRSPSSPEPPDVQGMALMRTRDLTRADGWQVWSPGGFVPPQEPFAVLPGTGSWDHGSLAFNTALCQFMIVYYDYATPGQLNVTTTASLDRPALSPPVTVHGPEYLIATPGSTEPGFGAANYANLIDPAWPGFNFEGVGTAPFLYFGTFTPSRPEQRDVYRVPLSIQNSPYVPVPLPQGLFRVGGAIYWANAVGHFCAFSSWDNFVAHYPVAPETVFFATPKFESIPSSMTYDGPCPPPA